VVLTQRILVLIFSAHFSGMILPAGFILYVQKSYKQMKFTCV